MNWILIAFMVGSHGERTASQFGPFASAADCQAVAAIVVDWIDSMSTKTPLCKEMPAAKKEQEHEH